MPFRSARHRFFFFFGIVLWFQKKGMVVSHSLFQTTDTATTGSLRNNGERERESCNGAGAIGFSSVLLKSIALSAVFESVVLLSLSLVLSVEAEVFSIRGLLSLLGSHAGRKFVFLPKQQRRRRRAVFPCTVDSLRLMELELKFDSSSVNQR